jgi:hypothetical protein
MDVVWSGRRNSRQRVVDEGVRGREVRVAQQAGPVVDARVDGHDDLAVLVEHRRLQAGRVGPRLVEDVQHGYHQLAD